MQAPRAQESAGPRRTSPILFAALLGAAAGVVAAGGTEPVIVSRGITAVDARSAALLMSGQEGGPIALAFAAWQAPEEEVPSGLDFVVDVHVDGLRPGEDQERVPLAIFVYALDAAGGVRGVLRQAVWIEGTLLAAPGVSGLKFFGRIELAPGDYSLRTLALRPDTGEFGITVNDAVVSGAGDAMAVIALEPGSRWLGAARRSVADSSRFALDPRGDGSLTAAARAVATAGTQAVFELLLLDGGKDSGWRAELVGIERMPAGLVRRGDASVGGWGAWVATVDARRLGPGAYRIELRRPDGDTEAGETTGAAEDSADEAEPARAPLELTFELAEPAGEGAPETTVLWTDLAPRRRLSPGVDLPEVELRLTPMDQEMSDSYLEAVGLLTRGDEPAALGVLVSAEKRSFEEQKSSRGERLMLIELQVAAELGRTRVDSLPALIRLHERLYVHYIAEARPALATRARRLATRLANLYVELRPDESARHLAARALESLAGRVLVAGGRVEAARLFAGALEFDPESPAALQGLGVLLEFEGRHRDAVSFFERALAIDPDNAELQIHYAINLGRTGERQRMEEGLRACVEAPGSDWIRVVAQQELARSLATAGRFAEAITLLEEEIGRAPDPGLMVQLAALLDAAGRRAEATDLLVRLERTRWRDTDSPRLLYARRTFEALGAAQAEFDTAALGMIEPLAAAYQTLRFRSRRG